MKVQIRKGVFETNSSSMHALALQKEFTDNCETCKDKYKDLIPEHITMEIKDLEPKYYDKVYHDENTHKYVDCSKQEITANKIMLVYANIIGRMAMSDYGEYPKYGYVNLTMFFSWLNKLGITYDIPYQPEMFWVEEGKELNRKDAFFYDMLDDELWEVIFDGKEETFCNFLFGNGSQLDGFETDCIPWDKYDEFEKVFYDNLDNHGKCQIFSHYNG